MLTILFNAMFLVAVTEHLFTAEESDRGFAMFLPPTELNDPGKGFLVDDKVIIEADITFPKVH
ncbi:hypothetical protein KY290_025774 [Solanum tuberosum]|uniref:MATH domain-containing protein n=1 Tax=Solanum tuberosum TaxID=4113 RepID=A0ABQ7UUI5_SOLTU|nr:hypothetical protein KY289_024841 [Solanum tuberosum]KAH0755504.1 hypothetical protein KY290_025774 [Solanum tuberosum]